MRDVDFMEILQFLKERGGLPRPVTAEWRAPRGEGEDAPPGSKRHADADAPPAPIETPASDAPRQATSDASRVAKAVGRRASAVASRAGTKAFEGRGRSNAFERRGRSDAFERRG